MTFNTLFSAPILVYEVEKLTNSNYTETGVISLQTSTEFIVPPSQPQPG